MKSKRLTTLIIMLLTIILCLGNVPLAYAAEFSSGEDYLVENSAEESIQEEPIFSDSIVDENILEENIVEENTFDEEYIEDDVFEEGFVNEDEANEDISAELFTDTEILLNESSEGTNAFSSEETVVSEELVFVNPLYRDVVSADDLAEPESTDAKAGSQDAVGIGENGIALFSGEAYQTRASSLAECSSVEEAAVYIRNAMKNRETTIQYVYAAQSLTTEDLYQKMEYALAHTGNPVEGDYLKYQYAGFRASATGTSNAYTLTWTITYYTTAEQEQAMNQAVAGLLNSLKLTGKSDYEKVAAIYDYICSNVTYDYTNLNNSEYKLKYSGYAALVNKTAVCQGYAVLMYRLLLECGVDSRIIAGVSYSDKHSWNIIKLGNAYYNVDATWDAGYLTYKYFLKCQESFTNHTRDEEYASESFFAKYPIAAADYVVQESDISTGTPYVENDIEYRIVNGTAVVIAYHGTAERVVIPGTVNGASVTAVSDYAFYGNDELISIEFKGNAPAIAAKAFYGVEGVAAYPHGNTTWTTNIFEKYAGDIEWAAHGDNVHVWKKDTAFSVEATCESDGHYEWVCQVCGEEKQEEVKATGHNWSEWTTVQEASYGADGSKERICGNCEKKETETIAKKVLATPIVESVKAVSGKKIEVTWSPVEGAAGYYIYCKTENSGWSLLTKVTASENSYIDSTPTAGIVYTYTVRAYVTENNKTYSSGYETGKSAAAKTAAPAVTVTELAYNKVKVTWNTVEDAVGYRVYRKVAGGSWKKLKNVTGTTVSYTDSTAVPGTKYYYTVRGYCKPEDTKLWGSYKASKAITTKTAAPALVSAKSSSYKKIKITWKLVDGASGYRVYRKEAGGSWKKLKNVGSSVTSYTDSTAVTGTTYYYTVRSYRKVDGKTVWGRYDSSGIKGVAKTSAPKLVSAKILSSGKTKITWEKVAGASGYRVYVKTSSGKWQKIKNLGSSATSYTYSKSYGKSAVYTVRAYRTVNDEKIWGYYKSAGIKSK